jgi:hypothetical protein
LCQWEREDARHTVALYERLIESQSTGQVSTR